MIFKDRIDAGKKLAEKLSKYKRMADVVVLGLPRGGVLTAFEIVKKLNLPLDIVVPRKIGAPGNEEFAVGAITESGEKILDENIIRDYGISREYIERVVEKEKNEAKRRIKVYRGGRKKIALDGKTVILVDDGIATGFTMRAAIKSVKAENVGKIVVAVPVLPEDSVVKIGSEVDELVYLDVPGFFGAIGAFYEEFGQTTDDEVVEIMETGATCRN